MDIYDRIRRINEKPTPSLAVGAEMKDVHALEDYKVWCFDLNCRSAPAIGKPCNDTKEVPAGNLTITEAGASCPK